MTDEAHSHEGGHHAPYMLIWGVLLVMTLAEVGYAFLSLPKIWLAIGLMVMAVWKALLVALYFMHLRFEGFRMRIFALAPLPLTVIIVIAVMTEFIW